MSNSKIEARSWRTKIIAFYLPQFHPIPENDQWWGGGFTEWTNVTRAKPLYRGHHQPNLPADLGFYDLRLPETRQAQADLARSHGVYGFCYWHYWFAGKRILERPFNEVLATKQPDFPFCLAWANETWAGWLHGSKDRVLIEQSYPGIDDYERHFYAILPALRDPRYIRINNNPLFVIYRPKDLPNTQEFVSLWNALAGKNDLPVFHFAGVEDYEWNPLEFGFNSLIPAEPRPMIQMQHPDLTDRVLKKLSGKTKADAMRKLMNRPKTYNYSRLINRSQPNLHYLYFPCVIPNWDNTPRAGKYGFVFEDATPEMFAKHLTSAIDYASERSEPDERIVFLKSWNEWAEGNYVEPDTRFGHAFLEVIRKANVSKD